MGLPPPVFQRTWAEDPWVQQFWPTDCTAGSSDDPGSRIKVIILANTREAQLMVRQSDFVKSLALDPWVHGAPKCELVIPITWRGCEGPNFTFEQIPTDRPNDILGTMTTDTWRKFQLAAGLWGPTLWV